MQYDYHYCVSYVYVRIFLWDYIFSHPNYALRGKSRSIRNCKGSIDTRVTSSRQQFLFDPLQFTRFSPFFEFTLDFCFFFFFLLKLSSTYNMVTKDRRLNVQRGEGRKRSSTRAKERKDESFDGFRGVSSTRSTREWYVLDKLETICCYMHRMISMFIILKTL